MSKFTQANRPLKFFTPLGPDALLPVGFEGREAVSELYEYRLELLAEKSRPVAFEKLLGQKAGVELTLSDGAVRHFHGIVTELSEEGADEFFIHYRAVLAPAFWRLTKRVRFRIFQDQSAVDILKAVLTGLDVRFHLLGAYRPWNFRVQYQESDFAFASRLMEEEGILYYFEHGVDHHTLVVTDQSLVQPDIAGPAEVRFDATQVGPRKGARVTGWKKTQQLCSGKVTFWDYNFEMPEKHLEATQGIQQKVNAGTVPHALNLDNDDLEIYRFTGGYGGRYDSINQVGADQAPMLQNLFKDNQDFARLRMEQEASQSLRVEGSSNCGRFLPGHHFTLAGHAHADGAYFLSRVTHHVRQTGYRSGAEEIVLEYRNEFMALPKELPFRPPRLTPWPQARSLQTAVVVGPKGEEIFTDKFGRVKVQFLWDRDGKSDAHSSCWIRVAQAHAGKGFGFISLPRVGEEVVVGFAGDNPDRPLIVGRVYNAVNPPPFDLPTQRTRSGLKTHSIAGNAQQFSGLAVDDQTGREHVGLHSEQHMTQSAEGGLLQWVGGDHQTVVGGSSTRIGGYPGALRNSPAQPQGSGAGGGTTPAGLAGIQDGLRDADVYFGWASDGVIGTQSEMVLGQHIETTVNPIGGFQSWLGTDLGIEAGAELNAAFVRKLAGLAFGSAHTEVTIGNHNEILHGVALEFTRGKEVGGADEHASPLARVFGLVYTLVAMTVDLLMPLAELAVVGSPLDSSSPDENADSWGQVAEKEALNLAGRVLLDAMLAVWIGIEMKSQAVKVEKVIAEELEAALKNALLGESKNAAEALIKDALAKQTDAMQKSVDALFSKQAARLQEAEKGVTLANSLIKSYEGLYTLTANSMNLVVQGKDKQESTALAIKSLGPPGDLAAKASIELFSKNLVSLQAFNGALFEVAMGAGGTDTGNINARSGKTGSIRLKMGEVNPTHALLFHNAGVKMFSREGGIHILHGASGKFEEIEAAEAPRKIVIESRDAPVEIRADRILLKAGVSIRMECGANFFELNETGIIQNGITTSTAADAAFMELASMQVDMP